MGDYNDLDILISAIFTNLLKNEDFQAKTLDSAIFSQLYSHFQEIFDKSYESKKMAFFSHFMHISKCQGITYPFFEERVLKMKKITVRLVDGKVLFFNFFTKISFFSFCFQELAEISRFHLTKVTQDALKDVWTKIHDNLAMPQNGYFAKFPFLR